MSGEEEERKTTHELARELLALPDVPLSIWLWTGETPVAKLTDYDDRKAIITSQDTENAEIDGELV